MKFEIKSRDRIVLTKMLDEIRYLINEADTIKYHELVQDDKSKKAMAMTFINIGEFVNNLTIEFKRQHSYLPYREIVDVRNYAAHGYYKFDFETIWNVIKNQLPDLESKIKKILTQ